MYNLYSKAIRLDDIDRGDKRFCNNRCLCALNDGDGVAFSLHLNNNVFAVMYENGLINLEIWKNNIMIVFIIFLMQLVMLVYNKQ